MLTISGLHDAEQYEVTGDCSVTSKCGDLALQVGGVSDETVK
jgi:hypothetical protein